MVSLPYKFKAEDYQKPLAKAILQENYKRYVYCWHRRAGKDLFGLNMMVYEAIYKRIGPYWHIFPQYNQGRNAIWQASTHEGVKYLDCIPKQLIKHIRNDRMEVEFINGSSYKVIGSDNKDAMRGSGPVGVLCSEFALQKQCIWSEIIQPMLARNGGTAGFNFTPNGKDNHAYDLLQMARQSKRWFTQVLTVDDTQAIPKEELEIIKEELSKQTGGLDIFNQEYYCDFNANISGAVYGVETELVEKEGRYTNLPYNNAYMVETFWDLGVSDSTAIWFTQYDKQRNVINIIDYIEDFGKGLDYYIKEIKNKPYVYNSHNAPHDIVNREFTSGISRLETAKQYGINFNITPKLSVADGINRARSIFSRCIFNKLTCEKGFKALKNYKRVFNEKLNKFSDEPLHDWTSHGADAFRYMAVQVERLQNLNQQAKKPAYAIT